MASVFSVLRTCGLIVYLILQTCAVQENGPAPWIVSMKVNKKNCVEKNCKYLLNVRGGEFLGHYSWRLTPEEAFRGGNCDVISPNYELKEIFTDQWLSTIEVLVPNTEGKIYFCLHYSEKKNTPFGGKWVHQGEGLFLDPKNDVVHQTRDVQDTHSSQNTQAVIRDTLETNTDWADLSHDIDVNHLPSVARPTRHERKDIEVLIKDKYVPLNEISDDYVQRNNMLKDNNNVNSKNEVTKAENDGNFFINGKAAFETWNDNANLLNRRKRSIVKVEFVESNIDGNEHTVKYLNSDTTNNVNDKSIDFTENKSKMRQVDATKDILTSNIEDTRMKRKVNSTDELITSHDIVKAKQYLENAIKPVKATESHEDALIKIRKERQTPQDDFTSVKADPFMVKIEGLRVEDSDKEPKIIENGIPSVLSDSSVTLRLFGEGLTTRTMIAFTYDAQDYGEPCKFLVKGEYLVIPESLTSKSALVEIVAPHPILSSKLYICAKNLKAGVVDPFKDEDKYLHQGTEPFKILATHNKLLPLWVTLTLILICLMFSALFSGLNLGLMSLDRTELKIISNTGTEQERKYARAIMPVRDHGNYLLCSILLGNVAVNSTFTILLDELTSGLFAVIFSTLSIVLLGEITPQAICSRHGLMVGAKSIMITKAVMAITAPLAFPVSKLLDYFLGEEIGSVYNRERLKELVKVTTDVNDLDKDEVNIISGALELRKKTVSDVMTKLEDVFMLPISSVLDFETMSEIVKSGYSRIPVYEAHRGNIITVLFIKDLAFVDPDDNTPLRTLCQYYQNPCNFVFEDVTLDVMFRQFKDGHKGHMAFVHRINNEGEGDPFYETMGLVTLEDVIEEMIQAEIVDETDVFMDNRTKRRRNRPANKLQDFTAFAERHENQRIHISPQLTLATFQFLSTSVDAFRPDTVSETVLRRLLKQDVIQHIKLKGKTKKDPSTFVYHQGKPVDYFVLILEGRVEVTVGRENLVFEAGPFTYFGVQALMQNVGVAESPTPSAMGSLQNINMDSMLRHTFVPDYSVRAITEVFYLTVKRSLYLAAKRATLMEKGALSKGATNEQFDTEVDKHLCNSSSANIPISMISKKLLGKSTSTASTKDDLGSTSTGYKLPGRANIIELLQVAGAHSASVARLPDRERPVRPDRLPSSWPDTPTSYADGNLSSKSYASSWETARWCSLQVQDPTKSQPCWPQDYSKSLAVACVSKRPDKSDVDALNCSECVRNNFWINKSVLNKSIDDVQNHDTEHSYKKKKTTFHADSSLLTFHPVSPPTHDIDMNINLEKQMRLDAKSCCSDAKISLEPRFKINPVISRSDANKICPRPNANMPDKYLKLTAKRSTPDLNSIADDSNFRPDATFCSSDAKISLEPRFKINPNQIGTISNAKDTTPDLNAMQGNSNFRLDAKNIGSDAKTYNLDTKSLTLYAKDNRAMKDDSNSRPDAKLSAKNSGSDAKTYNLESKSVTLYANDSHMYNDPQSSADDREFEHDLMYYSLDWREERLALEKKRIEMEEKVLTQLSRIIRILEMKDQT